MCVRAWYVLKFFSSGSAHGSGGGSGEFLTPTYFTYNNSNNNNNSNTNNKNNNNNNNGNNDNNEEL